MENLYETGRASLRPVALAALSLTLITYCPARWSGSAGVKVSCRSRTTTVPLTAGSMAKAPDVLAASIGWSKVTTTGAVRRCSSPRSGLTVTTVGGSGARVGEGSAVGLGTTGAVAGDCEVAWAEIEA